MEIKPTGLPAAAPEPVESPVAPKIALDGHAAAEAGKVGHAAAEAVPPPAMHAAAKAHVEAAQDHLEVYVPPKLDLGHGGLGHLPDPSDLGKLRHDLGSELPADLGIGPAEGHPPTPVPPQPDPPPSGDLVSKFRDPMIDRAAFSPEVGGTEQGPQGTPKRPAIRHGLGPGHFTAPHVGDKGAAGPGGFHVPVQPHPTDPRASAPTRTEPAPAPIPPDDPDPPPDPPQNVAFSASRLHGIGAHAGAAMHGETFGVQDPGPPTNPPDPGPPEPPPQPD